PRGLLEPLLFLPATRDALADLAVRKAREELDGEGVGLRGAPFGERPLGLLFERREHRRERSDEAGQRRVGRVAEACLVESPLRLRRIAGQDRVMAEGDEDRGGVLGRGRAGEPRERGGAISRARGSEGEERADNRLLLGCGWEARHEGEGLAVSAKGIDE